MIRLKQSVFFFLFVVTSPYSLAQNQNPCAPETSQFDFWIGKWNVA